MIHIAIDNKSIEAKALVNYLKSISKTKKFIDFVSDKETEEALDIALLNKMKKAKSNGLAKKNEVMNYLAQFK
ncbi:MAG: hypothetical protein RL065_2126 [Bacteroidota bacterium]